MATTLLALASRALVDIGVLAASQTPTAQQAEDARVRANNMIAGWQTQSLTVLAVERQLFNITPNQQSYTIGVGGDFNVPRPVHGLKGAGLLLAGLNGAQTITSITRAVNTATATTPSAHGLIAGSECVISGCTDPTYNGTIVVQSAPTTLTFTYTVEDGAVSPALGTPVFQTFNSSAPVEIPRAVITDDGFQALQIKRLSSQLFTEVYYNPTIPFGTIFLWPSPPTAANQLALYLESVFAGFADVSTPYDYPDVPGYAEAIEYNLTKRLAISYGRVLRADLAELAVTSLATIKRANYKLSDLPTDPALTTNLRGGYNIVTGSGG